MLARLTGLTITNLVVWISSFVFINMLTAPVDHYDMDTLFLLLLLSIVLFQLFFFMRGHVDLAAGRSG